MYFGRGPGEQRLMNLKSILSFVSKLSKRERLIFYVTIGIVGFVLLDRLIISPILTKISYLNETIRIQEESIEQSLLIVTQEKRIEKEASQYSSYLSQSQTGEKAITAFLKEVETLAKKSSVYLIDIKPTLQAEEGAGEKYFVRINFEAQMDQVINFFYYVASFEQLIKIEEYQIRPKTVGSSVITCSASVSKTIIPE